MLNLSLSGAIFSQQTCSEGPSMASRLHSKATLMIERSYYWSFASVNVCMGIGVLDGRHDLLNRE
jgi:hypothetical protein